MKRCCTRCSPARLLLAPSLSGAGEEPAEFVVGVVRMFGAGSVLSDLRWSRRGWARRCSTRPTSPAGPAGSTGSTPRRGRANAGQLCQRRRPRGGGQRQPPAGHDRATPATTPVALVDYFGGLLLDGTAQRDAAHAAYLPYRCQRAGPDRPAHGQLVRRLRRSQGARPAVPAARLSRIPVGVRRRHAPCLHRRPCYVQPSRSAAGGRGKGEPCA